jgi:hypothetical protein
MIFRLKPEATQLLLMEATQLLMEATQLLMERTELLMEVTQLLLEVTHFLLALPAQPTPTLLWLPASAGRTKRMIFRLNAEATLITGAEATRTATDTTRTKRRGRWRCR